jgi:hypothetical protein
MHGKPSLKMFNAAQFGIGKDRDLKIIIMNDQGGSNELHI